MWFQIIDFYRNGIYCLTNIPLSPYSKLSCNYYCLASFEGAQIVLYQRYNVWGQISLNGGGLKFCQYVANWWHLNDEFCGFLNVLPISRKRYEISIIFWNYVTFPNFTAILIVCCNFYICVANSFLVSKYLEDSSSL